MSVLVLDNVSITHFLIKPKFTPEIQRFALNAIRTFWLLMTDFDENDVKLKTQLNKIISPSLLKRVFPYEPKSSHGNVYVTDTMNGITNCSVYSYFFIL